MGIPRSLARRSDAALNKVDSSLLAEALRRGEATRNVMEDALVDYGRWILVNVFGDDAAAALDGRSKNAVWVTLLRRAGGPTLRLSRRMLYVAVEIAARDKRINDDVWRTLEPGRKELLLPLADEPVMRKAAKQAQLGRAGQSRRLLGVKSRSRSSFRSADVQKNQTAATRGWRRSSCAASSRCSRRTWASARRGVSSDP